MSTTERTREKLVGLNEASDEFNVTVRTLMRWIKFGMPTHQPTGPGGKHYVRLSEVETWITSRCTREPRVSEDTDAA